MTKFDIEIQGENEYLVHASSPDGTTTFTLALGDAADITAGQLSNDETTARAVVQFLLQHQDAGELPERFELDDVIAAGPDAADAIKALRG